MSVRSVIIWGGSLFVHAGLALSVGAISPVQEQRAPTKIVIREIKPPKPEKPAPPPPVVPPVEAPAPAPAPVKPKAAPKPSAAPPPSAPAVAAAPASTGGAVPSFGLTLSGGVGSGGVAVAAPSGPQPTAATVTRTLALKALVRAKPAGDVCSEALIKPKPLNMPQPAYPAQAREAGIAGKVRVELRVDAQGQVASARVLEGLGHGLDEAALEAARGARFEPAMLCGRATETVFVIGMRFSL
ncbi:MAG TPA: TonB family protein [Polyangiales bacterium]|nr:TonB family protein [Polyangiales bacterium]